MEKALQARVIANVQDDVWSRFHAIADRHGWSLATAFWRLLLAYGVRLETPPEEKARGPQGPKVRGRGALRWRRLHGLPLHVWRAFRERAFAEERTHAEMMAKLVANWHSKGLDNG